jgi:uncharacterized protein YndB with AHSA1/START domain
MKWALFAVLAVVGIVLAVVLIGMLLPKNHTVSRSRRFNQPPEQVWAVITGPPTWRSDVRSFEELPIRDGHRLWKETGRDGQTIPYEAIESAPPSRLVTRIADPALPFGGTWTCEIAPQAGGSLLTITENGEVYNPIFRFMSRFVFGHATTLEVYLKALSAKFGEGGN